jgi:hypothetical protein
MKPTVAADLLFAHTISCVSLTAFAVMGMSGGLLAQYRIYRPVR